MSWFSRLFGAKAPSALPARVVKGVDWSREPAEPMWFEQPDAPSRVTDLARKWQIPSSDAHLNKWLSDGYIILDDCFSEAEIDRFASEVDAAWFAPTASPGLAVSDVCVGDVTHVHMAHADLLALDEEARIRAKAKSNWRIGEFHLFNDAANRIFRNAHVAAACSALFDRPALPHFSLTFSKGSQQALHQDTCVFHTWPFNALIGVWIALEDIKPDAGPLVYYPGSHREPLFPEFDNYPQTQRRTASSDQAARYDAYVADIAKKYERREFLARKGQALLWHGMLIHGGSNHVAPDTTRKSFVIHYLPNGGNVGHRVEGPFNW
jgi:hypothetical protein